MFRFLLSDWPSRSRRLGPKLFSIVLFSVFMTGCLVYSSAQKGHLLYYEDRTGELDISDILNSNVEKEFAVWQGNSIRLNLTNSAIWLKFRVPEHTVNEDLFLELSTPNLHYVSYYVQDENGAFAKKESGFLERFGKRCLAVDRLVFPVLENGEWAYIRIKTSHFFNTNVELKSLDQIIKDANQRTSLYGIYFGLMFILIVSSVLFAFHGKEYQYLFYAGYLVFISAVNLSEKGFYFQFVWPDKSYLNYFFPLLPPAVSVCLLFFLKATHKINVYSKNLFNVSLWMVTVLPMTLIAALLIFQKYMQAIFVAQLHSSTISVVIFIICFRAYKFSGKNRPFIKLVMLGLCCFYFGLFIYLLGQNGIIPINFLTENAVLFGSLVEVLFFTASIAFHYSSIAQKYFSLIVSQNELLQEGILARTIELNRKNQMLEISLEEKENLFHVMAHDLKSPLSQTTVLAQLIRQINGVSSDVTDLLNRIQFVSEKGVKLIEELGTVAQLESDNEVVHLREVNVTSILENTFRNYASLANGKNISLIVHQRADCFVKTYDCYLIRIVENLLSNAIKFSPCDRNIEVTIDRVDFCEITIKDEGPGFHEADLNLMFRKFQKLTARPTAGEHSTGLGLYITKLLADRIDAIISLESTSSKGSTFKIQLKSCF